MTSSSSALGILLTLTVVSAGPYFARGQSLRSHSLGSAPSVQNAHSASSVKLPATVLGEVTGIQGNILQISGALPLDVSQATLFSLLGPSNVSASSIPVGTTISAVVNPPRDSSAPAQASTVTIQVADEGVLLCPLDAVDPANGTITMLNMRIRITDQTFFPEVDGPKSIAELTAGRVLNLAFRNTENGPVALFIHQLRTARSGSARTVSSTSQLKLPAGSVIGEVTGIQGNILQISGGPQIDISHATFGSKFGSDSVSASSIARGTTIRAQVTPPQGSGVPAQAVTVSAQVP
ncbi:MAG: hypothetical protein ACREAC_27465, partial [Blastocatellia bacterium]